MFVVGYCATQEFAGQSDQQKPVRIQTDWQVQQASKITGNRPIYPAIASSTHVEGVVYLDCVISTDGSVVNIVYLSGPAMLIQTSIDAVRGWRFKPTLVDGIPVEVETIARIDFFLSGNGPSGYLLSYQKDVQKHPNDAKAREALGKALLTVGEPNQAILEFRQAVLHQPENASYHFELGNAIAATGDFDGAIGEYRSGLLRNPGDAFAHDKLAGWLERRGDLDGAIAEVLEAIKFKSREIDGHFHLGTLLGKKGDLDGAIVEFNQSSQQNPYTHFNLGRIYERKGDLDAALKEYKTAVHACPSCAGFQEARERVAKLSNK
jgi:TonB family protein